MAGLNLNALKNISLPVEKTPEAIGNTAEMPLMNDQAMGAVTSEMPKTQRISLTKLRLDSTDKVEQSPIVESKVIEHPVEKMRLFPKAKTGENAIPENSILPTMEAVEKIESTTGSSVMESGMVKIIDTEVSTASQESASIFNNTTTLVKIEVPSMLSEEINEGKELFPRFQLEEDFDFSDSNLLKLEDESEKETAPILVIEPLEIIEEMRGVSGSLQSIETIELVAPAKEPIAEVIPEESIVLQIDDVIAPQDEGIASIQPLESNPIISGELPGITPEYVDQVKTQLSEKRSGRLSFFTKRKSFTFVGIGIITISLGAFLLMGPLSSSIPLGKVSVTEHTQPTVVPLVNTIPTPDTIATPIIQIVPETITPTIDTWSTTPNTGATPVYSEGRDYTIIKNTKKNHHSE